MTESPSLPAPPVSSRRCPVCGAAPGAPLYQQRFEAIPGARLLSGYDVSLCPQCGFGFANGIPEQQAFDEYYKSLSKYENPQRDGRDSSYDTSFYDDAAEAVMHLVPRKGSLVLDIGCATGGLLAAFKRRGFTSLLGIDPSLLCGDLAGRMHGIRVIPGSLFQLPSLEEPAEFAIVTGVLEHVRELRPALDGIRSLLAPRGRVHVGVPDVTRFTGWPNAPLQHFSLEHINFFSPASLRNLMAVSGYREIFNRQIARQQSHGTVEPFMHAVFERDDAIARAWTPDAQTGAALGAYLAQSGSLRQREESAIRLLVDSRRPIVVWGVGTHTQRLLASTELGRANITAFVDSNPKYRGKMLSGRPILAPADLGERLSREAILISSWMYQREIEQQIREVLRLENEIIKLYESEQR